MTVSRAFTIAGSDSGGGAGIQADLKTFQELGVFGMSAITAVTAQNTLGVQGVYPLSLDALKNQIDSVATDLKPAAIKTGMLFNAEMIQLVADRIQYYEWENIVVDPVMIAKGGQSLLQIEAVSALLTTLVPLAKVITPNIPEAEVLTGMEIQTIEDKKEAAKKLFNLGAKFVMIKGGHDITGEVVIDLLYDGNSFESFEGIRRETKHTHGTGCTFAAAITAELSKGKTVHEAVGTAKEFIQAAIDDQLGIGGGHGPTNHWAYRKKNLIFSS
ncbi:bifunctional hydroxymethylpyrimidine kinase/phosphomethylpyrimidine kinase [Metabacillus halosaccharovorans]|uniref:Hydroxymethylpyrimidine/phosphomethylpyrimidine kinase n=1 Tax=Metabacillus halosaccharovorans TaxID=930124 RepID=A0ABT3DP29_9BACI|nr:bifunctional hydroxymethylpyrimidine kinase/phosphomethylpyrimidine kinase [Metabacillus halosaccharovorans]MCV9888802.1 bifunctional hydroxymethylpyrimidine kinase/phosphomethylpyrimidine kinase [Metabacillus halosaccharovorans]